MCPLQARPKWVLAICPTFHLEGEPFSGTGLAPYTAHEVETAPPDLQSNRVSVPSPAHRRHLNARQLSETVHPQFVEWVPTGHAAQFAQVCVTPHRSLAA